MLVISLACTILIPWPDNPDHQQAMTPEILLSYFAVGIGALCGIIASIDNITSARRRKREDAEERAASPKPAPMLRNPPPRLR